MRMTLGQRVIVIGGGASGVLAAVNLSRTLGRDAEVVLVEPAEAPGRGLAYSTRDPQHLLNVRVSNMSAFPNDPDHFFRWLQRRGAAEGIGCATHFCFVPRRVYGAYLAQLFEDALMENVRHLRGSAVGIRLLPDGVDVSLSDGASIRGGAVILATGHDPRPPRGDAVRDAWDPEATAGLDPDAEVGILGTGLTMVDVVLTLRRQGHRGRIQAISRRGLMPAVHAVAAPRPIPREAVPIGAPLSRILAWLRGLVRAAARDGTDWRSVVDGLRPHTRALWQGMDRDQRARFLRHARPWWDVHRHRMAPAVAETIGNLSRDRRLDVTAAKVVAVGGGAGLEVTFRRRGTEALEVLRVARLIDATGLPSDVRTSPNPVIRSLIDQGLASVDDLALGLAVSDDYAIVDTGGRPSDRLYAVGPLCRGAMWEMIAIPDIRQQCAELADHLAALLQRPPLRSAG
ncbi:FAD/NAD(P)-binding protein [Prosthecomicrobium sp. N25]|uniref:FAD/NAD(P)-binding protein n=1 Tax=Prosthecomicrobium sp. N25 TaxID=3129254 RepID=UPI0030784340